MSLIVKTPPAAEPLLAADVYEHLRITDSGMHEDNLVARWIEVVRIRAEEFLKRTLITTVYTLHMDGFADTRYARSDVIRLPKPPIQSVATVKYLDGAGVQQTIASSDYRLDVNNDPPRLTPAWGKTWPGTRGVTGDVEIEYTAGYGLAGSSVPEDVLTAMLHGITGLWRMRSELEDVEVKRVPGRWLDLLAPRRVPNL